MVLIMHIWGFCASVGRYDPKMRGVVRPGDHSMGRLKHFNVQDNYLPVSLLRATRNA